MEIDIRHLARESRQRHRRRRQLLVFGGLVAGAAALVAVRILGCKRPVNDSSAHRATLYQRARRLWRRPSLHLSRRHGGRVSPSHLRTDRFPSCSKV